MMHEFRICTIFHPIKVTNTIATTITIKNIWFSAIMGWNYLMSEVTFETD
jgi:hypothetical protein